MIDRHGVDKPFFIMNDLSHDPYDSSHSHTQLCIGIKSLIRYFPSKFTQRAQSTLPKTSPGWINPLPVVPRYVFSHKKEHDQGLLREEWLTALLAGGWVLLEESGGVSG